MMVKAMPGFMELPGGTSDGPSPACGEEGWAGRPQDPVPQKHHRQLRRLPADRRPQQRGGRR